MTFSICSAVVSVFGAISGRFKNKYNYTQAFQYYYSAKAVYKMKIECDKLESYHKYTHKMLTKTICNVLSIDNTGNIEVFYIVSARNAIIAYIEVTNTDLSQPELQNTKSTSETVDTVNGGKNGLFGQIAQFGDDNQLTETLKQELNEKLNLKLSNQDTNTQDFEPGQMDTSVSNAIKIFVVKDKNGMSFDAKKVVKVQ